MQGIFSAGENMQVCDFKRSKCHPLQKIFFCSVLLLSGTFLVKYMSNPFSFKDIETKVDDDRSKNCKSELYSHLSLRSDQEGEFNCADIIKGDQDAIDKGKIFNLVSKAKAAHFRERNYLNLTENCSKFKKFRKYVLFPTSREEEDFPIAYSMVVHDKIDMFERLLRAIYAPQNIYCVHVDDKSPDIFKEAVRAITNCFDNVFVASKLEKVVYASWSRVQADLNCMEDLLNCKVKWKYLLNTCGADFPLKTNAEIVKTLMVLNGKNSMESEAPSTYKQRRWQFHHKVGDSIELTATRKPPPPIDTPVFSGNAYFVASRGFVKYVLEEPEARKLIEWSKDTYSPDEHLWATLNRMPDVPGSSPHSNKYQLSDMNAVARMVKWEYVEGDIRKGAAYPKCTGIHRRAVCVYGSGDLNWLLKQHHLLANKFDPDVDDVAITCLEEYLRDKQFTRKSCERNLL
ncbi:beta-1,3-galactosyl-O-glycosyl-glycoprotein beta-1,6-N-acetylglucosaminyltransferase 3-like [Spea bombifrons]|uniref:beta-1,3-galactosyl-O-glycosyl-glycoprotein beta-1,6-N-acetylglucosaminyltransferase 3-like n=1 Tax=Spea bombifrons TaxID=233779 RepID=UPI00234B3ECA|nr:beta-1,3-galactosyl-O-glycosyl-glycoprotein beta-1,6-N-acetylglucosaminyltransferase 3-like [Spea bombifrons]